MADTILKTEALAAGYDGKAVIEHIDLLAKPGCVLTLIGPNGAGKSTILKTLIRQLPPVGGAVLLEGRDLADFRERELARRTAAVLTERPEPELMTCEDVVATGRYPYTGRMGILSQADREKIAQAMALVHVTPLRDVDFHRISDGQRQRVMLARAICQEPKVLLLDEPTSYLDLKHKLDFLHLLRALARKQEIAVILSLHELDLAQKFSDTVLCIRDGKVDRVGTPEEIFQDGYIEQLYGVERGRYDVRFGSVEPGPTPGKPRVFVLGGGGSGIPVYRALHRQGVPFAAGVLAENDVETPIARALSGIVFTVPAFEPVDAAAVEAALEVLKTCEKLICTTTFGSMNRENQKLLEYAENYGMI